MTDTTETRTARRKRLKAERLHRAALDAERRRQQAQRDRQRDRLRQRCCSAAWVDVIVSGGERVTENQPRIPAPTHTWRPCGCYRCRRKQHLGFPSIYITSSGHSYECYVESLVRSIEDDEPQDRRRMDEATAVMEGLSITRKPNQETHYRKR